jgi:hypothetical protein
MVAPFKCTYCGVTFNSNEGGLCGRTNRPYCMLHIRKIRTAEGDAMYVGINNVKHSDQILEKFAIGKFLIHPDLLVRSYLSKFRRKK